MKSNCLAFFIHQLGAIETSSLLGHGKRWVSFPVVTEYFIKMNSLAEKPPADNLCTTQRFIIILYLNQASTYTNIDMGRKHLFTKKVCSMKRQPLRRWLCTSTFTKSSKPRCIRLDTGMYSLLWTIIPQASLSSHDLVRYGSLCDSRSRQCS